MRRAFSWRALPFLLLGSLLGLILTGSGSAQERTKVRLVHVAYSPNQAVAWIARDAGYFAQQGLEVEILRIAGSSTVVQSMVAGQVELAQVGAAAVIESVLAGADLAIVAATVRLPLFRLMAHPTIKSTSELKGKILGITRFGSSTDFLMRWALANKWGLSPEREVSLIQVGGIPELLAAAKAGAIHAAPLSTPDDLRAEELGWKELADFRTLGFEYMTGTLAATRKYIAANEEVLRRFMKAYVQAIHRMRTDKAFTLKSLGAFAKVTDQAVLESMYRRDILNGIEKVPLPSSGGIQTVLDELAQTRPAAKSKRPSDFIDARFIQELQAGGYIDGLYR